MNTVAICNFFGIKPSAWALIAAAFVFSTLVHHGSVWQCMTWAALLAFHVWIARATWVKS